MNQPTQSLDHKEQKRCVCAEKKSLIQILSSPVSLNSSLLRQKLNVNLRIDHNIWKNANPYQREEVVAWGAMVQQGREEGGKRMGSLALLILDLLP